MRKITTILFLGFLAVLIFQGDLFAGETTFTDTFESGFGNWVNVTGDNANWTWHTGTTETPGTGPSSAHGGSYYVYTEATGNFPNYVFLYELSCSSFTLGSGTVNFWYHMNGSGMGSLSLEIYTGSSWEVVWSKSGTQGESWLNAVVNLDNWAGTSRKLRFKGITGGANGSYSDMALDDVVVTFYTGPDAPVITGWKSSARTEAISTGECYNDDAPFFDFSASDVGTADVDGFYYYWGESPPGDGDWIWLADSDETDCASFSVSPSIPWDSVWYLYVKAQIETGFNSSETVFNYNADLNGPLAPEPCYCENQINPSDVYVTTPLFWAYYLDNGPYGMEYEIEVGTSAGGSDMWDSGWVAPGVKLMNGSLCPPVVYAGASLSASTAYYWKIRFKDSVGNIGDWSDNQTFTTGPILGLLLTVGPAGGMPGGGTPQAADFDTAESTVLGLTGLDNKDLVTQQLNLYYRCFGQWDAVSGDTISGWTCNDTYKLRIEPGYGMPLIYNDDTSNTLYVSSAYVEIRGIHILENTNSGSDYGLDIADVSHIRIADCILNSSTASGYNYASDMDADYLVFDNCLITGTSGLYESSSTSYLEIKNCTFRDLSYTSGSAIYKYYAWDVAIHHNLFVNIEADYGIYLYNMDNALVYDNIIDAVNLDYYSIYCRNNRSNSTQKSYIVNNTIHGVQSSDRGIYLYSLSYGMNYVYNNIIYMSGAGYGLYYYETDESHLTSNYNCVYRRSGGYFGYDNGTTCSTLSSWRSDTTWGDNSIESDPDFISTDTSSPYYGRLENLSPCVDAGLNMYDAETGFITTDYDYDPQPASLNPWCIGADLVLRPWIYNLYGRLGDHGGAETPFDNGSWYDTATVHFHWDNSQASSGFYWYWGNTAPSASDYTYTTYTHTSSHAASSGVNYFYLMATTGSSNSPVVTYVYNYDADTPITPSPCYTDGLLAPVDVSGPRPAFIATYNDATSAAEYYYIQVGTTAGGSDMWDSGWVAMTETSPGDNSPEISYAGTALSTSATYYWRIRFRDKGENDGVWSADQQFSTPSNFTVTITIGPAGSLPGGGDPDETTITAAESAIDGGSYASKGLDNKNLVLQQINVYYELYGTWRRSGGEDVSGWTCDADYKLRITAGSGRPTIIEDSNSTASGYTLRISSDHVDVSGIHLLANTTNSSYDNDHALDFGGSDYHEITDCILDSTGSGVNYASNVYGSYLTFDNCTFTGYRGIYDTYTGETDIEIKNCLFRDITYSSGAALYKSGTQITRLSVHHCDFFNLDMNYAIYLTDIENCFIFNNRIDATGVNSRSIAVDDTYGATNQKSYIVNNTIYGVQGSDIALYLYDLDDGMTYCYNNIIYMSGSGTAFYTYLYTTSSNLTCNYNCVYQASGGYYGQTSSPWSSLSTWQSMTDWGDNSIDSNPQFISTDPANSSWLKLKNTSPCIGAGRNIYDSGVSFIADDYEGEQRPLTGAWCMGADEKLLPSVEALEGYFNTHSSPGASFGNNTWGAADTVHFSWECSAVTSGFYWYWGTSAPAAGDYAYATNKYTESHTAVEGTNYFYVMGSSGIDNSAVQVFVYNYDKTPVVTGVHVQVASDHTATPDVSENGGLAAGTTQVYVDYGTIAELRPDCTSFTLTVTGGTGSGTEENESDSTTPLPGAFTVSGLTGATRLDAEVGHMDKTGSYAEASSASYYVKPYQPQSPLVERISLTGDALRVTVRANASEDSSVEHAIYCVELDRYVNASDVANATDESSAAWRTASVWGTRDISGLIEYTTYNFRVKSRNVYGNHVYSDWSADNSAMTDDVTNPVITSVHLQTGSTHTESDGVSEDGGIAAGTAQVYVDYDSIVEPGADCTSFTLAVTGGSGGGTVENDSDVETPTPGAFNTSGLNGASSLSATIGHRDQSGNYAENSSGTYYVKPYTPPAPAVSTLSGCATAITVDVTAHASEAGTVEYAIYCFECSSYVAAGGAPTAADEASALWQTEAAWGAFSVSGLYESTDYTFRVKSRNTLNNAVYSDWSANSSASTDDLTDPVVTNAHIQAGAAHTPSDGIAEAGGIAAGTTTLYGDYDSIVEISPDCTSFILEMTGGSGGGSRNNTSDTTGPAPAEFTGLTLDGATRLRLTVGHKDKIGRYGFDATGYYYVKPYQPQAPTVTTIPQCASSITLTVNADASENAVVEYAVYSDTHGMYVAPDDTPTAADESAAAWRTAAAWASTTLTGLTEYTTYTFRVKSRNYYGNTVYSDWSPDATERTDDATAPTVTDVHVQTGSSHTSTPDVSENGGVAAGTGTLYVDYGTIIEAHPGNTTFTLTVTGGSGSGTYENAGSGTTPAPYEFTVTGLCGISSVQADIGHTDMSGNYGENSSGIYYVKPYAPLAPYVTAIDGNDNALELTVNPHASEDASVEYAVYCTTDSLYVQSDGTLGASPYWAAAPTWSSFVVMGLVNSKRYDFYCRSRNTLNNAVYSDWSPTGFGTVNNMPPRVTGAHVQSGAAHASGDGYDNAGGIPAGTSELYVDYDSIVDGDPDCSALTLAVTGGTGGGTIYNDSDTTEPATAYFSGLTLTGASKVSATVEAVDNVGGYDSDTSSDYYVKPYTPLQPVATPVPGETDRMTVDVRAHASEDATVEYAIEITGPAGAMYVAADGTPTAASENSAAWKTESAWGTALVTGLSSYTNYTVRVKSRNSFGQDVYSDWSTSSSATTPSLPSAPAPCYCEGLVNPGNVTDVTPEFTATYVDNDSGTATEYQVQVGSDSDWTTAEMWDSGARLLSPGPLPGENCALITYEGDPLEYSTSYYWRIRMRGYSSVWSDWSATQQFRMTEAPTGVPVVTLNLVSPTEIAPDNISSVNFSTVFWQTSVGGTYRVELGGDGTPGSGVLLENGSVVGATPTTTDLHESELPDNRQSKIFIIVDDGSGNRGYASFNLTDDQTAPSPRIGVPSDGSVARSVGIISGTAEDVVGVLLGVQISVYDNSAGYYLDGGVFSSASEVMIDVAGLSSWSFNASDVSFDNAHTFTVRVVATDTVGLEGEETISFTVDSRAPNVTMFSSDVQYINESGTASISWQADLDGRYWLVVGGDGSGPGTGTVISDNLSYTAGTVVTSDLTGADFPNDALSYVYAYVSPADDPGIYGSAAAPVVNDVTAPTSSVTQPVNGSIVSNVLAYVAGTASDNLAGVAEVEFVIKKGTLYFTGSDLQADPYYFPATGTAGWYFQEDLMTNINGDYTVTSYATDRAGNRETSTDSITFTFSRAPGQAGSPTPADGADNVSVTTDLSWAVAQGAETYRVYFGVSLPGTPNTEGDFTTWDPGTIQYETTYQWRIDAVNANGTTTGAVWTFHTQDAPPKKKKSGSGGFCFVASVCCSEGKGTIVERDFAGEYRFTGSTFRDVQNLRAFRDEILDEGSLGRDLKRGYYAVAPVAAAAADRSSAARTLLYWTFVKPASILAAEVTGESYTLRLIALAALSFLLLLFRAGTRKRIKTGSESRK